MKQQRAMKRGKMKKIMKKDNFERFYCEDNGKSELIAVRSLETGEILPVGKDGDKNERWLAQKEDIERFVQEREKLMGYVSDKKDIEKKDIEKIDEIDLTQKINKKEENKKEKELTEKQVRSIGGMSNEVKTSAQIDSRGTTLGKALGLEEYESIYAVSASKLKEFTNGTVQTGNTLLAPIGKKKDGTYEVIPPEKLRPYMGNNNEITEIDDEPESVKIRKERNIFEVPNTGKRLVINQEESYGTPNIYYAENTRDNDGNVGQKLQDKYDGTQSTDVKMRELFNKNKGVYNIEKMHDEAEVHKENKCEELGIDEVDGDLATGHTHNFINENSMIIYNGKEMKVSEVASLPRFNISGEEFARIYNEIRLNNEKIEQEEIYDKIEDEVNDDLRMPQERR